MGKTRRRRVPRKAFSTRTTFIKNYKRKQDSRDTTQVVDRQVSNDFREKES